MQVRLPVGGGPLRAWPMIATGADDTTTGFSHVASGPVNLTEVAAAVVVALNTCQHVSAVRDMEREELTTEEGRWEEIEHTRPRKQNWGNNLTLPWNKKENGEKKGERENNTREMSIF